MTDNNKDITKLIEKTYALVFKKNYTYDKETLDYSIDIIEKELKKLGIKDFEELNNYTTLNVGTGSESIALEKLGAKMTYHIDVSNVAVNSLKKYIEDNNIKNISSNLFDLCSKDEMNFIQEKCELVYLNGVLQHLYNPLNAMINVSNSMKKDGRIFIRTYRNESWLFFMVSLLRRIFKHSDVRSLLECCIRRAGNKDIYSDLFVCEMFDDIFVPVINIYSYFDLKKFFENIGFEEIKIGGQKITENGEPYLEMEDTEESIMIAFRKKEDITTDKKIQFPKPINQLENFKNNEKIQKLLKSWKKLEDKLENDDNLKKKAPDIIYDLYHYASFRRERKNDLNTLINEATNYIENINR